MLQTVQKVAQVLNLFSIEQPEWTVGEVAHLLHMPKSSTSELLSSMAAQNLLRRTGNGRYRLAWRLLELGQTLLHTTEFRAEARTVMQELVQISGETTHLAAMENGQVVYIEKIQGTYAMPIELSNVGVRLPAHCSGVGKVLLAACPSAISDPLFERLEFTRFTDYTIRTRDELEQQLDDVRQQGYAYDLEEVQIGLCCVAAPIYDYNGEVIAAVSMSLPAQRFYQQQDRYTSLVVRSAQRVSANLGYRYQERKDQHPWLMNESMLP